MQGRSQSAGQVAVPGRRVKDSDGVKVDACSGFMAAKGQKCRPPCDCWGSGSGGCGMCRSHLLGAEFEIHKMENVLEMGGADSCTTF